MLLIHKLHSYKLQMWCVDWSEEVICRVWLCNTSSALMLQISSAQIRPQVLPKLFMVNSWIARRSGSEFQTPDPTTENAQVPKVLHGKLTQLTVDDIWKIAGAGDQQLQTLEIPWILMPKTTMDCHSKLVLHSLRNNQPVQVIVYQPRQTTLIFPGPSDQRCCSILNVLQLVHDVLQCGRQNRVTIVDVQCDKGVD